MKIVLVDDERLLLKDLQQMLSVYPDIEITAQFTDSLAALDYINTEPPDAVILDINMPRLNGMDLAGRLLEIHPQIEIVFVTAYDEHALKAFELNAIDYLLKPVEEDRLEKTIAKLRRRSGESKPDGGQPAIRVQYFGRFDVLVNEQPARWRSRKAQELAAFLLARGSKSAQKHVICDALYPDMDEKSAVLNVQSSASRARQSLADCGSGIQIVFNNDSYQVIIPAYNCDLPEMEELLKEPRKNAARIKELYKDGYMAENGWLWSYSAAAIWDERLADIIDD